ncbi:MAG: tRNA lysidine(34) synthetase TilS [Bacteroidetes bacterium]|nr:tRNA lysidine(34) synthetase TilS [Bacteroidota bacterium]
MTDLISKLDDFIKLNSLFDKDEKILIAVSGGFDSMFLLNYLYLHNYNISVAHCNFNLRGEESNADEKFVLNYCNEKKIECFVKKFDTVFFAESNGLSIQMAARELRYNWFDKVCLENGISKIITAHHKSDNAETMLINIARGTGLKGLEGIPLRTRKIVRPMLCLSRNELKQISMFFPFDFREDSSNSDDKYYRNKIRQHVIPEFIKINHSFEDTMYHNAIIFLQANGFIQHYIEIIKEKITSFEEDKVLINIDGLLKSPQPQFVLYYLISDYGFNASVCNDIFNSLSGISGKSFYSSTHIILKDRNELILRLITPEENPEYMISAKMSYLKTIHHQWIFKIYGDKTINKLPHTAMVDFKKLKFPLTIRKWQKGDKIKPLGMAGTKKISDILIDKKISNLQKQKTWVVVSGKDIVWLSGLVINDNYKITESTKKVFEMSI